MAHSYHTLQIDDTYWKEDKDSEQQANVVDIVGRVLQMIERAEVVAADAKALTTFTDVATGPVFSYVLYDLV